MWKESYLIGDEQIDQQHRQLVGALEDLLQCANRNKDALPEHCKQTMRFLKDYSVNHFNAEEMLQQAIGFPHCEEHRAMHEGFKQTLHEIDLRLMRSDYDTEQVQEVITFLTQWWIFHIVKEDKKMMAYL